MHQLKKAILKHQLKKAILKYQLKKTLLKWMKKMPRSRSSNVEIQNADNLDFHMFWIGT